MCFVSYRPVDVSRMVHKGMLYESRRLIDFQTDETGLFHTDGSNRRTSAWRRPLLVVVRPILQPNIETSIKVEDSLTNWALLLSRCHSLSTKSKWRLNRILCTADPHSTINAAFWVHPNPRGYLPSMKQGSTGSSLNTNQIQLSYQLRSAYLNKVQPNLSTLRPRASVLRQVIVLKRKDKRIQPNPAKTT
jgi:hypothetical protein